jgi:transmembrane sensor
MSSPDKQVENDAADTEDRAADLFLRHRAGKCGPAALQASKDDPGTVDALRRVERAWQAVGDHATSPELMKLREEALARARRANARRWVQPVNGARKSWLVAAAILGVATVVGGWWQLTSFGSSGAIYETPIGEQRVIELDDHSRIALDAKTRLRVSYTAESRNIEIEQGQAQFTVAKDPARPFKVVAGDHVIVALGTVFTVEYMDDVVHVAMLEGRVAVTNTDLSEKPTPQPSMELVAGEGLQVRSGGRAIVTPRADLEAATAWRQGKVIFHDEPLGEAVRRLNRYSRLQLTVDGEKLEALKVSGVFEAGDNRAFAEAVRAYLPITMDYADAETINLRMEENEERDK